MIRFRVKPIIVALLVLLIVLQYELWFEPTGMMTFFNIRTSIAEQKQANDLLRERNEALIQQVTALKNGNEVMESRARNELGMVKTGEVYYQVVSSKQKSESTNQQ